MSYVNVWVHLVWSTKNREPFFRTAALRQIVFSHIRDYGRNLPVPIHVDFINGYTDHVHVLVSLEPTQTVAEVAQALKGESSNWLKQQRLVPAYFAWQTDYFAVSVSVSLLNKTRDYIRNQEVHHQTRSLAEEQELMRKQWGLAD